MPAPLCTRRELPKQPRLAYSWLTDELDSARAASIQLIEGPLESIEFIVAPDEALTNQGHVPP